MNNSPPPATPSQACRRFTYETGQNSPVSGLAGVLGGGVSPNDAFEQFAYVAKTACWLLQLDCIIAANESTPTNVWIVAWDVSASDAAKAAAIAGTLGAPRYTYGRITPGTTGGMLIREPQEWFQLPTDKGPPEEFAGQPFDRGILLAVSSTPRLYTQVDLNVMSVIARVRR